MPLFMLLFRFLGVLMGESRCNCLTLAINTLFCARFSSQPCESTFRQFRSFSSTYSTVITSTLKEAASRLSKIQLQNENMNALSKHFVFPGLKKSSEPENSNYFNLPSKSGIMIEIENCQQDAICIANIFGLITRKRATNYACKLNPHTFQVHRIKANHIWYTKAKLISQLQRDKYAQISRT